MKKRISKKKAKKELKEQLLNKLISNGLKLSYIKYLSGYFIFNFGENKVVHFKIDGIDDILFGAWNVEGVLELFGEVETYIDKFKPTRCDLQFSNVDELISFAKDLLSSYDEKFVELLRTHYIDDFDENGNKISDNDVIEEYKDDVRLSKERDRYNGFTIGEYNKCKEHYQTILSICKEYDLMVYRDDNIICYKDYASLLITDKKFSEGLPDKLLNYIEDNRLYDCFSLAMMGKNVYKDVKRRKIRNVVKIL